MYKEILISRDSREGRAAVVEDGALTEILIAREERQVGSIYKARVANVLPGMNAAFVDIGSDRNAFLCADDAAAHLGEEANERLGKQIAIRDILKVNDETLVQVVKEAVGTKGARVTTFVTLPGRNLVLIPNANYVGVSRRVESESERQRLRQVAEKLRPQEMGMIIRTAASGRTEDELAAEIDLLMRQWEKIQKASKKRRAPAIIHQELSLVDQILRDVLTPDVDRMLVDDADEHAKVVEMLEATYPSLVPKVHLYKDKRPLFEFHGIDAEVDKALKRKVWLESGGYLIIDHTEALWVVDVNTGKYTGKNNLADTILKTNLEACVEMARQLRLRDMGGIIIIDFIDMELHSDRRKVLNTLNEELKKDRTRTHLVGMTDLGLVQLTRKREGKDLDVVLRTACHHCNGVGRVFSPSSLAVKVHREVVRVSHDSRHEAVLVRCHPRAALALVGRDGEAFANLEAEAGRPIFVQARPLFHEEHFEIKGGRTGELKDRLRQVHKGQKIRVTLEQGLGGDHALAVVEGNLIEVVGGADRVGQEVEIRLMDTDKIVKRAEIFR